mmetsp:Transcript_9713/g.19657  ORF Transcript_9713/g.19657 Transcript_9713/m.19657 type:complete len:2169 (-) Transcript_9713:18-6524(-)
MKGGKKSRLAERINRSRQLRQQLAASGSIASQSGGINGSNTSVTSSTDNLSLRSSTEEDETPALRQSHSVPEEASAADAAADASSLQTSHSFAAGRSSQTRAKRYTLVEKRRKAMQRMAHKPVTPKSSSSSPDSPEEKKMEDPVPPPPPKQKPVAMRMPEPTPAASQLSTARNTQLSPPRKNLTRARSISRERRQHMSPASSGVAAPAESQQTSLAERPVEDAHSEVNTDVGNVSEASTGVSVALSRVLGDEFGKPVVAAAQAPPLQARGVQPLHKQYQTGRGQPKVGRPGVISPPRSKETASAPVAETTKSPPRIGGAAPSRGRSVLVANALKKTVTKPVAQNPPPPEPVEEEQNAEVEDDTPQAEPEPRKWNMSAMKTRFVGSADATKHVVAALPSQAVPSKVTGSAAATTPGNPEPQVDCDTTKEVAEEVSPAKPPSSPPRVSVSAMKARFGSSTLVVEKPTALVPQARKEKTPAWTSHLKVRSPPPAEKPEEDQTSQADKGDCEQPAEDEEESPRRMRSPSPIWAQRRGLSPVPRNVEPQPVSAVPSWAKPKWQTGDQPPPPPRAPSPSIEKQSSTQGLPNRSISASPLPRSRPVVATPSWVRRPGSPSNVVQEEAEKASSSLPIASNKTGRNTPTWGKIRSASPQTVRTQVPRSTTPTWVKPQTDDEPENVFKAEPEPPLSARGTSRTLNWLQQKQQIVSSHQPSSGEEQTEAPIAEPRSNGENDRTMKWLQQRRQQTIGSGFPSKKDDDVVEPLPIVETPPVVEEPLRGSSRTKSWLRQKQQQVCSPNNSEPIEEAVEAPQPPPPKPSFEGDRTKNRLQQKQQQASQPAGEERTPTYGTPTYGTPAGSKTPVWVKQQQQRVLSPQPVVEEQATASSARDKTPSWVKNRGLSPVTIMKQPVDANRAAPSWAKPRQLAQEKQLESTDQADDLLDTDDEPEPVVSVVGSSTVGEPEEPSRFASAYVQRVVAKPADALKPQARKESPIPIVSQGALVTSQKPTAYETPSFRPSHKSSWSKYNRSSGSDPVSEASTVPPPPSNTGMEEGPSGEFTPSQLRARFRALDQRNHTTVPVGNKARGTFASPQRGPTVYEESLKQYDDPPLAYLSETETDIVEHVVSDRVTIETPQKVVVSAMAGRFGVVRGKQPKKTPPRVVRPNDYWRSPAKDKTPDPSSLATAEPQRRQLAPPSVWHNDSSHDDRVGHNHNDEPVQQGPGSKKDEMPSWLKHRTEQEVIVTSSGNQVDDASKEHDDRTVEDTREEVLRHMLKPQTSKNEKDIPWWLRPKQGDEGIKKVLQRAVSPEPLHDRELDLQIEEKPVSAPETSNKSSLERRRRLDDLLEMQVTSSSEFETEMDHPPQIEPEPGKRRGVIHAWHARSRQENSEETEESPPPLSESDTNGEIGKQELSKIQNASSTSPMVLKGSYHDESIPGSMTHEEENVDSLTRAQPAYSRPVPHFEDDEEYPEVHQNGVNQSSVHNPVSNVTPQPWRDAGSEVDQGTRPQAGSIVSGTSSRFESPGPSPVKPPDAKRMQNPTLSRSMLRIPALSPDEANNKSGRAPFDESMIRAPFDESTMVNDTSDLVIVESEKKEPRKKQNNRFALIRATASSESIELEPIGGTYFGDNEDTFELQNDAGDSSNDEHPWQKGVNQLSSVTWQNRSSEEPAMQFPEREDCAEETNSTQGEDAPTTAVSPNSLSRLAVDSIHAVDFDQAVRAFGRKNSTSHDDDRSPGTEANIPAILPPEFANSLSRGVIHDAPEEASSDVVFGEPVTYGKAGGEDEHEAPAVAERAKAIEDWKGGVGDKIRSQERNRHFFPENSPDNKDIFKEAPQAFGFEEESENRTEKDLAKAKGARGASAVLRFWATTSKDEMDEAQDWKDRDPDIDEYSDTEVQDDAPERVTSTTRLMASTRIPAQDMSSRPIRRSSSREDLEIGAEKPENAPPAELDPFSLETFAALNSSTPAAKKSKIAFDPFGDAFGDSVDFSSVDPDGLFAPSSVSDDVPSKKNLPTIAGPKKDTKPINDPVLARKRSTPIKRSETPTRTDVALQKMLGTPPRSPTRRPLNVNQIHEELNSLDQKRDYSPDKCSSVLRAPTGSGDESDIFSPDPEFAPRDENDADPKSSQNQELDDSVWSFEQGLSSYDNQDRYDADVETIDMATLDDSHPCEI